jgi:hypothetical protein
MVSTCFKVSMGKRLFEDQTSNITLQPHLTGQECKTASDMTVKNDGNKSGDFSLKVKTRN